MKEEDLIDTSKNADPIIPSANIPIPNIPNVEREESKERPVSVQLIMPCEQLTNTTTP